MTRMSDDAVQAYLKRTKPGLPIGVREKMGSQKKMGEKKTPATSAPPLSAKWGAAVTPNCVIIQVPFATPSLNEYLRWHWAEREKYGTELREPLILLKTAYKLPTLERARIESVICFKAKRKRDQDNYTGGLKPLIDAIKEAHIIAEDDSEVLKIQPPLFLVGSIERTTLMIYRIEEAEPR